MTRLARCALPFTKASCARVRQILEMDKDEPVRSVIPSSVRVASKPGDVEGVSTSWALVDLPDRPFVLTMMTNYGDSDAGRALICQRSCDSPWVCSCEIPWWCSCEIPYPGWSLRDLGGRDGAE